MRFLLVVNPSSGGGRPKKVDQALRYYHDQGDEVVVHWTSGPGDAFRFVRDHAFVGFDAVIAAGGDGTLHEVVGALVGSSVPLGILPWGTGNVFALDRGLPRDLVSQCRLIREGQSSALDVGLADGRPFLMMASVGLDAYALKTSFPSRLKRFWGVAAYALAGLRAFGSYSHPVIEVRLEDGTVDRGGFVLVSNTRLYGAFFVFLAQADPGDGLLDVLVFRDRSRQGFLGMVFHMAWATLVRSSRPAFLSRHGVYRTTGLSLRPSHRPAQVDGEPLGGLSHIAVAPSSLRVLLPQSSATHRNLTEKKESL